MDALGGLLKRWPVALLAAVAVLGVVAAGVAYYVTHDADAHAVLAVELAGSVERIAAALQDGGRSLAGSAEAHLAALDAGVVLVAGLGVAAVVGGLLGWAVFYHARGRRWAVAAGIAGVLAAVAGVLESLVLGRVLDCLADTGDATGTAVQRCASTHHVAANWAQGLATVTLLLLLPALVLASVAVVVTVTRLLRSRRARPPLPGHVTVRRGHGVPDSRAVWAANRAVPAPPDGGRPLPTGTEMRPARDAGLGICVSGGGIRSATVALGALHVLREHDLLRRADVLSSVSGGGYGAAAMRLALERPAPSGPHDTVPADVYAPGSPELDRLRRHGRYLADGATEWARAVGVLLVGVVANLTVLVLLVVLAGRLLGHLYAAVDPRTATGGELPGMGWAGVLWVGFGALAIAAAAWVVGTWRRHGWRRVTRYVTVLRRYSVTVALLLFGLVLVVPVVADLSAWLTGLVGPTTRQSPAAGAEVVAAGTLATLAGYAGTLAATLWRSRTSVGKAVEQGTRLYGKAQKAAKTHRQTTLFQRMVVYAGLAVVAAVMLFIFGLVVHGTGAIGEPAGTRWPGDFDEWVLTAVVAVVLLLLAVGPDWVRWSLHLFYKRRLAAAFAVHRVVERRGSARTVTTKAYDFHDELTPLDRYATGKAGFPPLLMAAAAHVSGQELAPPGRRVVAFTFGHDYVGSPALGWLKAADLAVTPDGSRDGKVPYRLGLDMTVQAAMAVSGAAFASAMGRHARAISMLLALTNARLGTWLPNPRFVANLTAQGDRWYLPRLPQKRGLQHLACEVLGIHSPDAPLLLVTDGGHYENLGLVELLRRRCQTILCLDASGGSPHANATLAEAIALAREELGVEVSVPDMDHLVAGSGLFPGGTPTDGEGSAERPRRAGLVGEVEPDLARACAVVGTVHYPDLGPGRPRATGRIVIGRAALEPGLSDDLLTYAAGHRPFPNDPTGDQWFDHGQFDAYHALGVHVGRRMVDAYHHRPVTVPAQRERAPVQ